MMSKRSSKFSIANLLMLTIVVALAARVSLDHRRIANLNRELAFHDAVVSQRALVEVRQLELNALKDQVQPQAQFQSLYKWIGVSRAGSGQRIPSLQTTSAAVGLRGQMARIRVAELRLRSEQEILRKLEQMLRLKVEGRIAKK